MRVIIPSQYGHKTAIKNARKPKLNQTLKTSHLYLCQPQNGEISTKKIQNVRKYLDKHLINCCIFRVLNMFEVCNVTNMTVF